MRWVGLRRNKFFVNYISPQAGNGEGGTVQLDGCTDRVEISGNIFTGPSAKTVIFAGDALPPGYTAFALTGALELYSRNTNITNNTITAYGLDGISALSLFNDSGLTNNITQNHVLQDNGWFAPPSPGITVATSFAGTCSAVPRETNGVNITANDSNPMYAPVAPGPATEGYGVTLEDHGGGPSTGRLFNVSVDSSNFTGAYPMSYLQYQVFLDPYVGLYGTAAPYNNAPSSPNINPRLLSVDVVDASSSTTSFVPLWPVPPLCSQQNDPPSLPPGSMKGSPRAKFKFSASAAQGAGNIAQIQGVWSTGGDDTNASGGPSGTFCNFVYHADTNVVYLWDNVTQNWVTSLVGMSGADLTASGCTIHAGSSSSWASLGSPQAVPKAYVMDLTLDVTLPAIASHYHIYSFVQDYQGNFSCTPSNSGCSAAWRYLGYWSNYQ